MADQSAIFQIEVKGLSEFESFLKKLTETKNKLGDIAKEYKNLENAYRQHTNALSQEQNRHLVEMTTKADINRANRKQKREQDRADEINTVKAKNLEIAGSEEMLTKKMAMQYEARKKSVSNFNGVMLETNKILGLLGVAFGLNSFANFATKVFEAQSRIEALRLTLKNLLGDNAGAKLFAGIEDFTKRTPFTIEQSIKGINQLVGSMKAAGVSNNKIANDSIKIMESLGNSAAALGDIGGEKFGRLTYAFTQVQAAGRLMGTEVRQLTEVGLPILALLADEASVSVAVMQKRIKDGQVGFQEFSKAILSAGEAGGVFAGSMNILAQTVEGKKNIIIDTLFFGMGRIGDAISETTKKVLDFGIVLTNTLVGNREAVERTLAVVKTLVIGIGAYIGVVKLVTSATSIWTTVTNVAKSAQLAYNTVFEVFSALRSRFITQTALIVAAKEADASATIGLYTVERLLNEAKLEGNISSTIYFEKRLLEVKAVKQLTGAKVLEAEATLATDKANKLAAISTKGLLAAFGWITLAVTAGIAIYQAFNKEVSDGTKLMSSEGKELTKNRDLLNAYARAVNAAGQEEKTKQFYMTKIIQLYPQYFDGLEDLTKADGRFNQRLLLVNQALDQRIKLAELAYLKDRQLQNQEKSREGQANALDEINKILRDRGIITKDLLTAQEAVNALNKQGVTPTKFGSSFANNTLGNYYRDILNEKKKFNDSSNTLDRLNESDRKQALVLQAREIKIEDQIFKGKTEGLKKNSKEYRAVYEEHNKRMLEILKIEGGEAPDSTKPDKTPRAARLKKDTEATIAYVESEILQNRRRVAEANIANAEEVTDKKRALAEMYAINLESLKAQKLSADKYGKEKQQLDAKFSQDKLKLDDDLNDKLKKSQKELSDFVFEQEKKMYEFERTIAHQSSIASLTEERDKLLAQATSEAERLAIIKEFNQRIFDENRRFAKENYDAKVREITDELALLSKEMSNNDFLGTMKKDGFRLDNPMDIGAQQEFNRQIDEQTEIRNNKLEMRSIELSNALKKVGIDFRTEEMAATKKHKAELANVEETAEQKKIRIDRANKLQLLKATQDIYKSIRLLVVSELDSSIASLEKIDSKAAKIQLARLKATRDGVKGAFDGIKNLLDTIKPIKIGGFIDVKDDKGNITKVAKTLGDSFKNIGESVGGKLGEGIGKVAGLAGKVAPILGGVIAAYKIFDTIMGAIEQNRLAKIKATQEAIIKANNKNIAALNEAYAKQTKALQESFERDNQLISKDADLKTKAELDRYGKTLERLIASKTAIAKINGDFNTEELRIRELYNAGLTSTDEKTRLETEAIVDNLIANIAKKRNDALLAEIELEGKRKAINKEAEDAITAIKKEGGENQQAEIDKVNAKRQEDLNALKTYTELQLEINANYDAQVAEARLNKDNLEISALEAKIAKINELRNLDLTNLAATNLGLSSEEAISAANLARIDEEKKAAEYARKIKQDEAIKAAELAYRRQLYEYELANFNASKAIQLAELKVEKAKAKRKLFGRGALLDAINEAIGEIEGLAFPPFAFKKGIDNTSDVANENVDGQGGFRAILHKGEQVMNEKQMAKMTKANFGIRPDRDEVINSFINYKAMQIEPLKFNPYVSEKILNTMTMEKELKSLSTKMEGFAKIVANKQTASINLDKNGYTSYLVGKNKRTEIRKQRFSHSA